MDLAKFAIEKRLVSILLTLVILLAGYMSYTSLPRFEDPEFIIRSAQVITPYSGASAQEVAEEVTDVIETAIQQLSGIKKVTSKSSAGLSEVTVEFTIAAAKTRDVLAQKFTQLRAKISDTERQLPPNAGAPQVYDDYGDVFAQYYAVTGEGYSLTEIYHYLKGLQRELVLVKGVSKVIMVGVPREVIYVNYQPVATDPVGPVLPAKLRKSWKGKIWLSLEAASKPGNLRVEFRPGAAVTSLNALEELVISDPKGGRSFRLKDIATVTQGIKDPIGKKGSIAMANQPSVFAVSQYPGGQCRGNGRRSARPPSKSWKACVLSALISPPFPSKAKACGVSVNDFVLNVLMALGIVVGTLLLFMGLRVWLADGRHSAGHCSGHLAGHEALWP